jgi:hypothetical protein
MEPIGFPETSVQKYHLTLRNISEECRYDKLFVMQVDVSALYEYVCL